MDNEIKDLGDLRTPKNMVKILEDIDTLFREHALEELKLYGTALKAFVDNLHLSGFDPPTNPKDFKTKPGC